MIALTLTNSLIMLLGLVLTWCILFSIFNEKSSLRLGIKLGCLVLFLSPFIAKFSYDFYATASRQLFLMSANGEIQLAYSSLKIPHNKNIDNYCTQFKDSKGKPLNMLSIGFDDKSYCGEFWGLYDQRTVFLPYKLLDNNQAMYWASPELRIVGPKPKFLSLETTKDHSNSSFSKKPKEIHIKEGQSTNIVIIKSFDITLENQGKKTINAGTVLSGFTLDPLHANDKPSPTRIKLMIGRDSCIASSTNPIRPDYTTTTATTKISSLNCSHMESNAIPIEAIASIPGKVLYTQKD
ncbi:MAG: hypothetical protein QM652_05400 [Legionella sp.]|uniref:hypothetical protein n=1 Tax=Legionella sp. TaxID=459 RepID=UPI0039E2B9BD